jgi:eukaryotic-like serine/threonine-protein kinase
MRPTPKDNFIGREILNGQFQIVQKIGTGGMGSVYKAQQPAMNRLVAIKILHPKLANRKDLVSRFRREARAMSQLTHPNTVKVFMYGELEEYRFWFRPAARWKRRTGWASSIAI